MDALAETEVPVSLIELHKDEPITNPTHPLYPTVAQIASYLNIDKRKLPGIFRDYPVTLSPGSSLPFTAGTSWSEYQGQRIVGRINFKDPQTLTKEDPYSRWVRDEEVFHSLHQALNSGFREQVATLDEDFDLRLHDIARGINEGPLVIEGLGERAEQHALKFIARTKLEIDPTTETSKDIRNAISYLVPEQPQNPNEVVSYLTAGQIAKIHSALNEIGLGYFDPTELAERYVSLQEETENLMIPENQISDWDENRRRIFLMEIKRGILRKLISPLRDRINSALFEKGNDEEIAAVKSAFDKARVPVFTIDYQEQRILDVIAKLPDDTARETVLKLLETDLSPDETKLFINFLISNIDMWNRVREELNSINADTENAPVILSDAKTAIKKELASNQTPPEKYKEALAQFFQLTQRTAVAEAMTENALFWIAEDLPADAEAREKLLSNPLWVKNYTEAVLGTLKDPNFSPLGDIVFNPETAARQSTEASMAREKLLEKSKDEPDTAAFMVDLERNLRTQRDPSLGSTYLSLRLAQQSRVDRILTDEDNLPLSEIPPQETWDRAHNLAFAESYEFFNRERTSLINDHRRQLLSEPIAKVVCAQMLELDISAIEFPQNMIGGYSLLLGSEGMKTWIEELWKFVLLAHDSKHDGEQMIKDFLSAKDFEIQKTVVEKYGIKVT